MNEHGILYTCDVWLASRQISSFHSWRTIPPPGGDYMLSLLKFCPCHAGGAEKFGEPVAVLILSNIPGR